MASQVFGKKIMEHRNQLTVKGSDVTQDVDMLDTEKTVEGMIKK